MQINSNVILPRRSILNFSWTGRVVLCVHGSDMYIAYGTKLCKSTDYGITLTDLYDFTPLKPKKAWKNPRNKNDSLTLVWVGGDASEVRTLYRSADDITFTSVLSDCKAPYNTLDGVDKLGNTICFSEYVSSGDHRIMRSTDNGVSWAPVLTNTSATSRHFHCLKYNPFDNLWYATTGDDNNQIHWYKSTDNTAASWAEITGVTWDQRFRTVAFDFYEKGKVRWIGDGDFPAFPGIYEATLTDMENTITCKLPLIDEATAYGRYGDLAIAGTYVDPNNPSKRANLYVSIDGGKTWQRDSEWPLGSGYTYGGFYNFVGIDNLGRLHFTVGFLDLGPAYDVAMSLY